MDADKLLGFLHLDGGDGILSKDIQTPDLTQVAWQQNMSETENGPNEVHDLRNEAHGRMITDDEICTERMELKPDGEQEAKDDTGSEKLDTTQELQEGRDDVSEDDEQEEED